MIISIRLNLLLIGESTGLCHCIYTLCCLGLGFVESKGFLEAMSRVSGALRTLEG